MCISARHVPPSGPMAAKACLKSPSRDVDIEGNTTGARYEIAINGTSAEIGTLEAPDSETAIKEATSGCLALLSLEPNGLQSKYGLSHDRSPRRRARPPLHS